MRDFPTMLFFIAVLLCPLFSPAYGQSDVNEGYDENTEITVRGIFSGTVREMGGPLMVKLTQKTRSYLVITAPPWFLSQENALPGQGSELEIKGSKYIGRDGSLYLVARQIKDIASGRLVVLRDDQYRPLWKGHRMHNRRMQ